MGTKVWVVSDYPERVILGVYDSEEKAKDAIESLPEIDRDDFDYYEYTINETKQLRS